MNELPIDLHEAVKTIASFCEFQVCHSCPFGRYEGCVLMRETPDEWSFYIEKEGDNHD